MMRKRRNGQPGNARAGESMLMVVVMMLVFFLLGAAVMTAASTASASASARIIERQGYYFTRSMMDTLDDSLQTGELGKALNTAIIADIANHRDEDVRIYTQDKPFTLRFQPTFSGVSNVPLTDLNGQSDGTNDVTISCVGRGYIVWDGDDISEVVFSKLRVTLSYACTYRGITTRMFIQYRYSYQVQNYGKETEAWTKKWDIQSAG